MLCFIFPLFKRQRDIFSSLLFKKQQMERRSARIQQRRERLAESREPEEEEHVAPPPRGRQNHGNRGQPHQNHGRGQPLDSDVQAQGGNEGVEEEVNQENNQRPEEELPPPPPTLAEIMDHQTRLMETLARRHDNGNVQGKMAAFMRLNPPTFDSSEDDPLAADDWLRTITKKLKAVRATDEEKVTLATHQLIGAAGEWWENYQDAVNDLEAIT
jgi:hypothetical protein